MLVVTIASITLRVGVQWHLHWKTISVIRTGLEVSRL